MLYHSEPITRNLIRNYTAWQAKKRNTDREFLADYEKLSNIKATRKERNTYFNLGVSSLTLFGTFGIFPFLFGLICSLYLDISFWYVLILFLIPSMIFYFLSIGFRMERSKGLKDKDYLPSFSAYMMVLWSLLGALAALFLGYLLSMGLH